MIFKINSTRGHTGSLLVITIVQADLCEYTIHSCYFYTATMFPIIVKFLPFIESKYPTKSSFCQQKPNPVIILDLFKM